MAQYQKYAPTARGREGRQSFVVKQQLHELKQSINAVDQNDVRAVLEMQKRIATTKFEKNELRFREVEEELELLAQSKNNLSPTAYHEQLQRLQDEKQKLYAQIYGGASENYEVVARQKKSRQDYFDELEQEKTRFLQIARKTKESQ